MSIKNANTMTHMFIKGEMYIEGNSIVAWLKDDLLYLLQHEDDEVMSSEYLQDRITLFQTNFDLWKKEKEKELESN
jgi:hypothetical protein